MTLRDLWWKVRWSSRATAWLHVLAMWAPFNSWRLFFYRLRGTRIGRHVTIAQGAFLEESRPWLLTIEDYVTIGSGVIIATHDSIYNSVEQAIPFRYGKVILKRGAMIAPGSIILPGVTIGEYALVAAGSVARQDVPPRMVLSGRAATAAMSIDEGLAQARLHIDEYKAIDEATKYPWRLERDT